MFSCTPYVPSDVNIGTYFENAYDITWVRNHIIILEKEKNIFSISCISMKSNATHTWYDLLHNRSYNKWYRVWDIDTVLDLCYVISGLMRLSFMSIVVLDW